MDMVRHMAGGEVRCVTARFRTEPRNGNGEEGVALMVVLLFILLLSVIVVEFAYEMQVEASLATNMNRDFQAYIAAKSAIAVGMELLQADLMQDDIMNAAQTGRQQVPAAGRQGNVGQNPGEMYDALTDAWAMGIPDQALNDAVMRCNITDECGKLNLNAVITPDGQRNEMLVNALHTLFTNLGVEEDPTEAILDWLDPDDNAEPEGAESDYYEGLETPYTCKNGPMDSIEELLLIAGIPAELYFDARYFVRGEDMDESEEELETVSLPDLLTVHGSPSGAVNVNTAHPEVLAALLENGAAIEDIVQMRLEEPFRSLQDFTSRAGVSAPQQKGKVPTAGNQKPAAQAGPKANKDPKQKDPNNDDGKQTPPVPSPQSQGPFTVQSNIFRIFGDGQSGDVMVRVEAYVFRLGDQSTMMTSPTPNAGTKPSDKDKGKDKAKAKDTGKDKEKGKGASEPTMESFRILDWRVIR